MWIAGDQKKTWKNLHVCQAEDAGTFWVREVPSPRKSEELTRFLNLENQMNNYFKKKISSSSKPNIGDIVCVCIKACWFRGRVDKVQEASKYKNEIEVFLLDYGEKVWVKESNLVCLKVGEWSSVPYQAKRVRLFGICPITLNYAFTKNGVKVVRSKVDQWEWDPAATEFVENLINNNARASFLPVLEKEKPNMTVGSLALIITAERWQFLPDFAREHIPMPIEGTEDSIDVGQLLINSRFADHDKDALLEEIIKLEENEKAKVNKVLRTSEQIHPKVSTPERSRGRGRGLISVSDSSSPGRSPSLSSVIAANGLLNCISPIRSVDNRSVASSKSDFDSVGFPNGSKNVSSDMEEIPPPKMNVITRLLRRNENQPINNIFWDYNYCKLSGEHGTNKSPTDIRKPIRSSERAPRKSDNIEETKIINLISSGLSPLSSCSSQSSLSPPNVSVRYEREKVKRCGSMDKTRRKSSNSYLTINNQTFDLESSSDDSDSAFEKSPKRKFLRAKRTIKRKCLCNGKDLKESSNINKTSKNVSPNISDHEIKIGNLLDKENNRNESSSDEKELKGPSHKSRIPDPMVQNVGDPGIVKCSPFAGFTSSEKTPAIEGLYLVPEAMSSHTQKQEASDDGVDKLAEFIKRIDLTNGYAPPFKKNFTTEICDCSQGLTESGEKQIVDRMQNVNILDEVSVSASENSNLLESLSLNTSNIDVTSWVSHHFTNRDEREMQINQKNIETRSDKTSSESHAELLENSIEKVDDKGNAELYKGKESFTEDTTIKSTIQRNFTFSCKSPVSPITPSCDPTAIENSLLAKTPKISYQSHSFALDTRGDWTKQINLDINDSEFIYIENKNSVPGGLNISRLFRIFVAGETQIPDEDVITKDNMTTLLNNHIVNILESMGAKTTYLQGYMWPLLCKGSSAVAVGALRSGKTMGYIVPLLSLLLDTWQYLNERLVPGIGAVMVIVCSGWRNVQCVGQCIHAFLPANLNLKVVTSWGGCNEQEAAVSRLKLLNGCDILITTAPHLSHLLAEGADQDGTPGTSLARCCHLVIDDAQHLLEYFAEDVKQILKSWGNGGIKKSRGDLPQQIVVVASSWQKILQDLTLKLALNLDLTMVISAPAEAAKAAKVKTIVHYFKQNGDAHAKVIELIRNTYASKRSLIFTGSNRESRVIKKQLESIAIKCMCLTEKKKKWEIQNIVRQWNANKSKTMLVSEGAIQELFLLDICNADAIIHTHVPEQWGTFLQNYSFMIDNFNFDFESGGKSECVSHVILLPSTVELKPFVIDELKKLGADIPRDVICSADTVNHENDQPIPLCHFLKFYGECKMGLNCNWRHKINVNDVPKEIPRNGDVDVEIVRVVDASRYLVRITEWRHGNTKINLSNNYFNIFFALQQHYADISNLVNIRQIESGQLCGVLHKEKWSRARIIRVIYSLRAPLLLLFLIDEGEEITLESKDVFELPPSMCILPQLIVEVYLCCIRPFDMDNEWTTQASLYVCETFKSSRNDTKFAGKIVLALDPKLWTPTLWLSPLVELVQIGTKFVKKDSIRSRLLAQRFGIDNPKHLELLKEQCKRCGIFQDEGDLIELSWKENYDNFEQLASGLNQQCKSFESLSKNQECTSNESKDIQSLSQANIKPPLPDSLNNGDVLLKSVVKCPEVTNIVDSPETNLSNGTHYSENTLNMNMSKEELPLQKEVQIEVGEVESPEWFFVIRKDNFDRLDDVENIINENKDWLIEENKYENSMTKNVPVHHHCIAKFTDGRYYRGWVDRDDGINQRIFFLDHGESIDISVSEVHPCPEKYLKDLPAQAIPCSLAHVVVPKSLQKKAAMAMERIVDDSVTWMVKALKVKENDDGMSYEVELVDISRTPPKQLWRQLLKDGVVIETLEKTREINQTPSCFDTPKSSDFCGDEARRFLLSLPWKDHPWKEHFEKLLQQENCAYFDGNIGGTFNSRNSALETHIESKGVQTDMRSKKIKEIDTFKDQPRIVCQNGKGYKGEKVGKKSKTFIIKNEPCANISGIDSNRYSERKFNGNTNNPSVNDKNSNKKKHTKKKNNQKKSVSTKRNVEKERNYFQKNCLAVPSLEAVDGVTERFNPITRWWQDQHMVYMKLSVASSTGYKCRLTQTNITFMTVVEERWFVMDEDLFGSIDPDRSFVKPEGTCIIISLTKCRGVTWSRLTTRDDALPWLTSQCTALTDEGSESDLVQKQPFEFEAFLEEVGAENGKMGGLPAGISDTSNSSCTSSNSSLEGGMNDMFS